MPPHDPIALGLSLPLLSVAPFAGLLLSIALLPLVAPALWARHYAKVCLAFGVPVAAFFLLRAPSELLHTALEYASFLILLASFFIFVVANIGGALTPSGDPPLFLGYLRGVPFFWTLRAMSPLWAAACALV